MALTIQRGGGTQTPAGIVTIKVKRIPATELEAGDFVFLPDIARQTTRPRTVPTSIPDFAHVRAVSHSQQGVVLVAGSFA